MNIDSKCEDEDEKGMDMGKVGFARERMRCNDDDDGGGGMTAKQDGNAGMERALRSKEYCFYAVEWNF